MPPAAAAPPAELFLLAIPFVLRRNTLLLNRLMNREYRGESAGSAISVVQVLSAPAVLFGPPLFGLFTDLSGAYRASWLVLTLIGLVGLITLRWVREEDT